MNAFQDIHDPHPSFSEGLPSRRTIPFAVEIASQTGKSVPPFFGCLQWCGDGDPDGRRPGEPLVAHPLRTSPYHDPGLPAAHSPRPVLTDLPNRVHLAPALAHRDPLVIGWHSPDVLPTAFPDLRFSLPFLALLLGFPQQGRVHAGTAQG